MKNRLLVVIAIFLLPVFTYAHTLLLNIDNNEDGTITVAGSFNTGQSAAGAQIRFESLVSGKILYKKRLPDESELTVKIPDEPYQIVLDGGPGHKIVKDGVAPEGGFTKKVEETVKEVKVTQAVNTANNKSSSNNIVYIVTIVLLLLTLVVSIRNTNKLMKQVQESK